MINIIVSGFTIGALFREPSAPQDADERPRRQASEQPGGLAAAWGLGCEFIPTTHSDGCHLDSLWVKWNAKRKQ